MSAVCMINVIANFWIFFGLLLLLLLFEPARIKQSNASSSCSSALPLYIIINMFPDGFYQYFATQPRNVWHVVDSSEPGPIFDCNIRNTPTDGINDAVDTVWIKANDAGNGTIIAVNENSTISGDDNKYAIVNRYNLKFLSTELEDAGTYACHELGNEATYRSAELVTLGKMHSR